MPEVHSLDICKAACLQAADFACHAILFVDYSSSCYRKRDIIVGLCDYSKGFGLYLRADPRIAPPPSPVPRVPGWRPPVVDELNARFLHGDSMADELHGMGLLVHQFDFMDSVDPEDEPWMPGTGEWFDPAVGDTVSSWDRGDRISAAIINAHMTPETSGSIPIYSIGLAGVIMSPRKNRMLCSHAYDVDSLERTCSPRGVTESCVPGCTHPRQSSKGVIWCNSDAKDISNIDAQWPCAWRPSDTSSMLQTRERLRAAGIKPSHKRFDDHKYYVEAVFDSEAFIANLPGSIEAVFFLDGPKVQEQGCWDCWTSGHKTEDYARRAHRTMLRHFGLASTLLPLLRFDPWNWEAPFVEVLVP